MRWWHHQLTHWIFIRTGQEMFSEKCEISKCHNFLISYPIFIIFAPICREICMPSFEIMVILDWISPLKEKLPKKPNSKGLGKFWQSSQELWVFKDFILISCMSPSQVALCYNLMSQQYNCLMELYTYFTEFYFSWKYIFPLNLYWGM